MWWWRNRLLKRNFPIIVAMAAVLFGINPVFACVRKLDHLFWAPVIDRVSGDCSFAGYQPNPSGILFVSIVASVAIGSVVWRTRK